jgi:pimeloyl-ACP methyl ester carboxylesterase
MMTTRARSLLLNPPSHRRSWVEEVFPDPSDPYDAVWHDKLAYADVGNGDLLALDLGREANGAVVYLSHDDGEGHGYRLASDFADLLRRWVPLACAGGEDWQWLPFTTSPTSEIDPNGANGLLWRNALGLT